MQTDYRGYVIRDSEEQSTRKTKTGNMQVRQRLGNGWLVLRYFPVKHQPNNREEVIKKAKRFIDDHLLLTMTITVKELGAHLSFFGIKVGMTGVVKKTRRTTSSKRSRLELQVKFAEQLLWIHETEVIFPEGYEPVDHGL